MANIPESSKVTFYKDVDIDITQGLEVIFSSAENQAAYFNARIVTTAVSNANFSYLRRSGRIKCGITAAEAVQCNYISFINPAFENRRFYAQITDHQYVNNQTTEIIYEIDYFQSYMFSVKYEYGMIEREHLSEADYQLSVANPWRRDVYMLNTGETLNVSEDLEEIYKIGSYPDIIGGEGDDGTVGIANYPYDDSNLDTAIIIQLADFDRSGLDMTEFNNNFNVIINSRGLIAKYSSDFPGRPEQTTFAPVPIGRGYGLYEIDARVMASGTVDTDASEKLAAALEWLTYNGFDSQVIGIFQIPYAAFASYLFNSGTNSSYTVYVYSRNYDVHNKKLLRFPYQYLRVYNNSGDRAEYKFELFGNQQAGGRTFASFQYQGLIDNAPQISLIPINYKRNGFNIDERMDFQKIPQVGYTTDAYLAFLASKYTENIGERTMSLKEGLQGTFENYNADAAEITANMRSSLSVSAGLEHLVHNLAAIIGGGVSVANAGNNGGFLGNTRKEANAWANGGNVADSVQFSPAERAYAADAYHAGGANETIGYFLRWDTGESEISDRFAPGTFTLCRVKLRDDVLQVFDDYFSGYGYASGRAGKPYACSYMEGDTENAPHFAPYMGKNVTYVKTSGMHVTHTLRVVSQAIEQMFNSGIQFLKGEDL